MQRDPCYGKLLFCLRAGTNTRLIAEALGVEGTIHDLRQWILQTARSQAFLDELLSHCPTLLHPVVTHLWQRWSGLEHGGPRNIIKRLRRLVHTVTAMADGLAAYVADGASGEEPVHA